MRLSSFFQASPLLAFLLVAAACGGTVVGGGSGGSGNGGSAGGSAGSDFAACSGPGQCVLTHAGCCGGCGAPDLSTQVAVNSASLDAYFNAQCPEPLPCPACAEQPNPNLFLRHEVAEWSCLPWRKEDPAQRRPPVPPGEPTGLNKERSGQCTDARLGERGADREKRSLLGTTARVTARQ